LLALIGVAVVAIAPSLLRHPTHHNYKKMSDGDVPQNLEQAIAPINRGYQIAF
jgi:hypothetical protein